MKSKARLDYLAFERFNPWIMKNYLTREVSGEVVLNKDKMMISESESNDLFLFLTILDKDYNYQCGGEDKDITVYFRAVPENNYIVAGAYNLSAHKIMTSVILMATDNERCPRYIITKKQLDEFKNCVFGT